MPTVHEILKQSGLSDEQIAALDAKAITAFTGVLSTAEQERQAAQESAAKAEQERQAAATAKEAAEQERIAAAEAREAQELRKRSNDQFYEESIVPALNNWGNEKVQKDAELAFYKTQLEGAKASGFLPSETPAFQPQQTAPTRDTQGRYVAAAPGSTPGSPTFTMQDVRDGLGSTLGTLTDIQWKYQRLFNEPLPISPTQLVREAEAQRLDPVAYAEKRFNFQAREQEIQRKAAEEHDAKIRQEAAAPYEAKLAEADKARQKAIEETNRKWAEKIGSNPDVRIAQPSRFADVARAVKSGERPDPLALNESQRRQATSQAIRQDISSEQAA